MITLNKDVINRLDISKCSPIEITFTAPCGDYSNPPYGSNQYRLLCYLSTCFRNQLFIDIGTNCGDSALALSFGGNYVVSFDINKYAYNPAPNCHYIIGDFREYLNKIVNARLVLYDIPHVDDTFSTFCTFLKQSNWNGILLLDDYLYSSPKKKDWDSLGEEYVKIDATPYGHSTGTGIVNFSKDIEFKLE
jgi:hypothetical protein